MWKYIRLKAWTKKKLFAFPYYEAKIKSRGFSSRKQNEGNLNNNQISFFFER